MNVIVFHHLLVCSMFTRRRKVPSQHKTAAHCSTRSRRETFTSTFQHPFLVRSQQRQGVRYQRATVRTIPSICFLRCILRQPTTVCHKRFADTRTQLNYRNASFRQRVHIILFDVCCYSSVFCLSIVLELTTDFSRSAAITLSVISGPPVSQMPSFVVRIDLFEEVTNPVRDFLAILHSNQETDRGDEPSFTIKIRSSQHKVLLLRAIPTMNLQHVEWTHFENPSICGHFPNRS